MILFSFQAHETALDDRWRIGLRSDTVRNIIAIDRENVMITLGGTSDLLDLIGSSGRSA